MVVRLLPLRVLAARSLPPRFARPIEIVRRVFHRVKRKAAEAGHRLLTAGKLERPARDCFTQRRYDMAYIQCMYARGESVPAALTYAYGYPYYPYYGYHRDTPVQPY